MIRVGSWSLVFFLLALSVCPASAGFPADGGWEAVSTRQVTVRYRSGSDPLASQVLEQAEVFLEETSVFLGLRPEKTYTIVIASSREEFEDLQPGRAPAPEWAGALTYPSLGLVLILSPGSLQTGGPRYWSLLRHEMVHLLLGDAEFKAGIRLPRWFQEGVATYISGEMNISRLLHLGWAQVTGSAPTFEELERSFPKGAGLAEAAYARSFLFIGYLTRRFGDGAVARLVEASLAHGGMEEGTRIVFGMPLADILEGFDQYAKVKATWIPVIASSASVWGMITLLFLLIWYRKRVLGLRTLERWNLEEEEMEEETTQDDNRHTLH